MAIYRKARFVPAYMLIVLFSLGSCGFAYKPTVGGTASYKMVYSIPLEGYTLDITAGGANKKNRDTGAFDVMVRAHPAGSKDSLTINWLRLTLVGRKPHVQPYVLKAVSIYKVDNWGRPVPVIGDTALAGFQLDTATYLLNYHFAGVNKKRVGPALRIDLAASIWQAGKTREVKEAIGFKRFFWLDIAGN